MASQGHSVFVLTSGFRKLRGWSDEHGMSVYRCRALRKKKGQSSIVEMISYIIAASCLLPGFIRRHSIESVIVFFSFPCGPLGLLGNILCKTPYIVSLRGGDVPGNESRLDILHTLLRPMRWMIFKKSNAVVANSEGLKNLSMAADPYQVHIIPNGVDTDFFKPGRNKSDVLRFLFVGRFQSQKNLFFLLEQMSNAAIENGLHFELHLVGDGPEESALKNFGRKLPIKDKIYWHNWSSMEKLREHYQKAHCLLNPSLCEGLPNVVLEAMACGIPVIASDVSGNNDIIRHKETGFLFDLTKPKQFRNALADFADDASLVYSMGAKGRTLVAENYSWVKTANEYLKLIDGDA